MERKPEPCSQSHVVAQRNLFRNRMQEEVKGNDVAILIPFRRDVSSSAVRSFGRHCGVILYFLALKPVIIVNNLEIILDQHMLSVSFDHVRNSHLGKAEAWG